MVPGFSPFVLMEAVQGSSPGDSFLLFPETRRLSAFSSPFLFLIVSFHFHHKPHANVHCGQDRNWNISLSDYIL